MKLSIPLSLAGILLLALTETKAAMIYSFDFNQTGSTVTNAGTSTSNGTMLNTAGTAANLHGGAGSGVSGAASDLAFDNTASSGMGSAGTGGRVQVGTAGLNGSISFTLTGWFETDGSEVIGNNARLFDYGNGSGFSLFAPSNGRLTLSVNGTNASVSATAYGTAGSWVFFAVTYDGHTVNYYEGNTTANATLVLSTSLSAGVVSLPTINTLGIGNASTGNSRPVDGFMDDFAVYGSTTDDTGVLSLAQIQAVQMAAIPEVPGIYLLSVAALLLLVIRPLKARRA